MTDLTYVGATGRPIDIAEARRLASEINPSRSRAAAVKARTGVAHEDFLSLGFVVEGLTREMLASARNARQRAIDEYETDCERARAAKAPLPKRPLPFDEEAWRNGARRVKVVARPFEIRSSAEQCAALALKSGWLVATVQELRRERKS